MLDLVKLDLRRREIGMSRATLARRAGISLPTVHRILSGKETSPTVATVEALATALGMAVRIVEAVDADEFRERQARRRATQLTGMVQGTMGLESQALDQKSVDRLVQRNVHRLLAGSGRRLWDE